MNAESLLLIDCLSDAPTSIKLLESEDADLVFNRDFFLKKENIVEQLLILENEGLIYANMPLCLNLTVEEKQEITIYLTHDGGKLWEKMFNPDWIKYHCDTWDVEKEETDEIYVEAGSVETIELFLSYYESGMLTGSLGNMSIISPWFPTYWKTLDIGYSVKFSVYKTFSSKIIDTKWKRKLIINPYGNGYMLV